jgi:tRNA pseudouridine(38-40) synthase
MRNIKLLIEYNGKIFNGWQKQPNKLNIQGEIEQAIKEITRRTSRNNRFAEEQMQEFIV